ncbi:MAG: ABC transporter ATP-binding protein [Comamonas sp.]
MTRNDETASAPLLHVRGLRVNFARPSGAPIEAVRDLNFDVTAGEIVALVGESGSGKSVTARALVGLAGARASVSADALTLRTAGATHDLRARTEREWRRLRGREIGFVLQDALVSLDPLRRIGREIAEPLITHRLASRSDLGARVEALLARAGIADPGWRAAQYPHELSGGLRQRALIASALAAEPRLLIADEPTTALDASVQQHVLGVFQDLAREGHGILLITHDLSVVARIAHRVAVMHQGRIVETGATQEVLAAPRADYTRALLAAIPTAAHRGRWLSQLNAHRPPPRQSTLPPPSQAPVLEIRRVSQAFTRPDGQRLQAVDDVSLRIDEGHTLGIVGESGSGKTTLGKIALALRAPDSGLVLLRNQPWSTLAEPARRPLRPFIQTISQDPLGTFDPQLDIASLIEQPLRAHGQLSAEARRARVLELLAQVGLEPGLLHRLPRALSGGQRQRVSIAQALASDPRLLVCDEPVSALDVSTQAQVLDLLIELQSRLGLAMLFISHDLGVVQHMSHHIAVMKDGRIVETGTTDQVFSAPRHAYTRTLLSTVAQLPRPAPAPDRALTS